MIEPFETFEAKSFPAPTPPFSVWLQVTDGNGRLDMRLVCERVPQGQLEPHLVVPVRFSLHFADPNAVLEYVATFHQGIMLEEVGRYRLRLTANGTTIKQRYFDALLASR